MAPGPIAVLLHRLLQIGWTHVRGDVLQIGWTHVRGDVFQTCDGQRISLLESQVQVLRIWLQESWQANVVRYVAHRSDYAGLAQVNPWITQASWSKWTTAQQGMLRVILNGTFICANLHFAEDSRTWCPACPTRSIPWITDIGIAEQLNHLGAAFRMRAEPGSRPRPRALAGEAGPQPHVVLSCGIKRLALV